MTPPHIGYFCGQQEHAACMFRGCQCACHGGPAPSKLRMWPGPGDVLWMVAILCGLIWLFL